MPPRYRTILLKLSGEALNHDGNPGISRDVLDGLAGEIREVHAAGVGIAVVVGGGNFFRGATAAHIDRVSADHMGMLATLINALALQDALEKHGLTTRVLSALEINQVAEPFLRRRALRHLERGRVIILAAGTGNPYFTTDSAAALRAMEIHADVLLKATKVDGIYTSDPAVNPDARLIEELDYLQVLDQGLRVMDSTAVTLCMENDLPIVVFNVRKSGNILRIVNGEKIGSVVGARKS